jgi:hypothetical protein
MLMVCGQAVISDLLKKPSPSSGISFYQKMKWENCGKVILNHSMISLLFSA